MCKIPSYWNEEIEQRVAIMTDTLAEPSAYNRFHLERIKAVLEKRKFKGKFCTITLDFTTFNEHQQIEWAISSFVNMVWEKDYIPTSNLDMKREKFEREIKTIKDIEDWLLIAEQQLKRKGLLEVKHNGLLF